MKQTVANIILFTLFITSVSFYNPTIEKVELLSVSGLNENDTADYSFIKTHQLYVERWDTPSQPTFWRTLMNMHHDSALINVSSTRQIIKKVALKDWNSLS